MSRNPCVFDCSAQAARLSQFRAESLSGKLAPPTRHRHQCQLDPRDCQPEWPGASVRLKHSGSTGLNVTCLSHSGAARTRSYVVTVAEASRIWRPLPVATQVDLNQYGHCLQKPAFAGQSLSDSTRSHQPSRLLSGFKFVTGAFKFESESSSQTVSHGPSLRVSHRDGPAVWWCESCTTVTGAT